MSSLLSTTIPDCLLLLWTLFLLLVSHPIAPTITTTVTSVVTRPVSGGIVADSRGVYLSSTTQLQLLDLVVQHVCLPGLEEL